MSGIPEHLGGEEIQRKIVACSGGPPKCKVTFFETCKLTYRQNVGLHLGGSLQPKMELTSSRGPLKKMVRMLLMVRPVATSSVRTLLVAMPFLLNDALISLVMCCSLPNIPGWTRKWEGHIERGFSSGPCGFQGPCGPRQRSAGFAQLTGCLVRCEESDIVRFLVRFMDDVTM